MLESEVSPAPPRPFKRSRRFQEARAPVPPPPPFLPNELEQILTRVPAAATVRFRAVCREWRAALASDHFVQAHQAAVRAAAAQSPPEIVFFAATTAGSTATSFYASRLTSTAQQSVSSSVQELVTVGDMRADDLVMCGTRPCRGLTLLFQPSVSAYHVCNLSTGEHVSLPPCPWARRVTATSRHEVYAYDHESNRVDRAFSTNDFVDTLTRESELLLNIAIHEEWATPVCRRHGAGDEVGKLKMKAGNRTVARQGGRGPTDRRRDDAILMVMHMFCLRQRDNNGPIHLNI